MNIAPETCARLAEHRNILGIKEASGDLGAVQRIRRLCPPDFYIWSGNDDETVPICALGGKGVISVAANVVPAQMHRLVELCLQNDFAAAGELQIALKPLCDALFCEVNPIPVKNRAEPHGLGSRSPSPAAVPAQRGTPAAHSNHPGRIWADPGILNPG